MSQVDFKAGARAIHLTSQASIREDRFARWMAHNSVGALHATATSQQPQSGRASVYSTPFPGRLTALHSAKGFERLDAVRKIAILRSNAIGDFIFSLPALEALRAAYPLAELVLIGQDWHASFLRGRPGPIDRVEPVPNMDGIWVRPGQQVDPQEVEAFFERMRQENFDIALQMHGGGRNSNPVVRGLEARLTAGARTPDADPLDRVIPYTFYQPEILRNLEIVGLVGAEPVSLEPHVAVTPADLAEAETWVPRSEKPLVILHPGAGDPRRRWPAEHFAAVGNALAWAGAEIAVIGIESDRDLVQNVAQSIPGGAIELCSRLSLGGVAGLMSRARLVISNDSGPLHLAAAVGTATVGIFWVGNLITAGPVTRRRHRPAISWRLDCPECGLNCTRTDCGHPVSFVADVSQVEVIQSAFELFEETQEAA